MQEQTLPVNSSMSGSESALQSPEAMGRAEAATVVIEDIKCQFCDETLNYKAWIHQSVLNPPPPESPSVNLCCSNSDPGWGNSCANLPIYLPFSRDGFIVFYDDVTPQHYECTMVSPSHRGRGTQTTELKPLQSHSTCAIFIKFKVV